MGLSRAEGAELELEEEGGKEGRDRKVSARLTRPYQQFPSSPCRMSEGRGVRNTDHFTDRSLKMLQLISWGRSHCFTRCCTLSPSGNPTDLGPGGKLSSTKLTLFCESKRQGEHHLELLETGGPGEPPTVPLRESRALGPPAWPRQSLPSPAGGQDWAGVCWQQQRCFLCFGSSIQPCLGLISPAPSSGL